MKIIRKGIGLILRVIAFLLFAIPSLVLPIGTNWFNNSVDFLIKYINKIDGTDIRLEKEKIWKILSNK